MGQLVDPVAEAARQSAIFPGGEMIRVYWYDHDCEWISKYCETEHSRSSLLPLEMLQRYATNAAWSSSHEG